MTNTEIPRIAYIDASSRVQLRLDRLDPERKVALVQIHSAISALCLLNRAQIREAFMQLRFAREAGWVIDPHLRALKAAHSEYVNDCFD